MKLFADENVPRMVVINLRERGHDILYASEADPGAADADWLDRAEAEGRLILTSDKDFGDLVFRDRRTSHGVVLLRLGDLPLKERLDRIEEAWASVEAHPQGKLLVITPARSAFVTFGRRKLDDFPNVRVRRSDRFAPILIDLQPRRRGPARRHPLDR